MSCRRTVETDTPPDDVVGLAAAGTLTGVVLDWTANTETDLAGYKVYRAPAVGGSYSLISGGTAITATTYTDTTGTAGTTYFYKVTAVDLAGNESPGSIVSAAKLAADVTAPADPTGLSLTVTGVTSVTLDWDDNVESDLDGYDVYRATSLGGTYTKLNSSILTVSTYTDSTASAGSTWYYKVKALDKAGNASSGTLGNVAVPASDTTAPAVPTGLALVAQSTTAILVSWTPNTEPDFATYTLQHSTDGVSFSDLQTGLTSASYTHTGLTAGSTHYYKVKAIDSTGNSSAFCTAVSLTLQSSSTTYDLTSFTKAGTMVPTSVHIRGVPYSRYEEDIDRTAKTVVITYNEVADFRPLGAGTYLTARYDWNFAAGSGQNAGPYAQMRGFNAACAIDIAGTYTHQLTRTDENGTIEVFQVSKTYLPDTRTKCYVSSTGDTSSTNNGTDITKPVALSRAQSIANANATVKFLFRKGDTFSGTSTLFTLTKANQMMDSYYDPAKPSTVPPVFEFSSTPTDFRFMLVVKPTATNAVIQNINLNCKSPSKMDYMMTVEKQGNTLLRNINIIGGGRIVNVDPASDGTKSRYILVQDVKVTTDIMRDNFCFCSGEDVVFVGCSCTNSVNEHTIRVSTGTRVNIFKCSLGNKDRSDVDVNDSLKSHLNLQQGMYVYVSQSTFTSVIGKGGNNLGSMQIGPLGSPSSGLYQETLQWIVVERCITTQGIVLLKWGASDIMIRNNIFSKTGNSVIQLQAVGRDVDTFGKAYSLAPDLTRVYIYNNTLQSDGTSIKMFYIDSKMNNLDARNNLVIAAKLSPTDSGSCNAQINTSIQANVTIKRNVWPTYDRFYVNGMLETLAIWNKHSQVNGNDTEEALSLNALYKVPSASQAATFGRPVKAVWEDYYGTSRSQTAANWTAGAVQGTY